ncbi:hypothetical protein M3Y99_00178100 [Aphelenchoides fujianensis]|nr:hypothetical protein M3Y99_00178100 [Aphelenchoides fujianensis]
MLQIPCLLVLFSFAPSLAHAQGNKFHVKCDHLTAPALFFNESCFVATSKSFSTDDGSWKELYKSCGHFSTPHRRLAFVRTPEHVNQLVSHRVLQPNTSYFVGSRQMDVEGGKCGAGRVCCPDRDSFFYVDQELKKHGRVNPALWLRKEPDNRGPQGDLPERLVALEHADRFGGPSNQVGFNDVDGVHQNFPLLCEYKDDLECPVGMVVAPDGGCVGVQRGPKTPEEAKATCESLGRNGVKGTLPSIHDDVYNTFLSNLARRLIATNKWDTRNEQNAQSFQQYWPVLFGMSFFKGQWVNEDGTPTDYFRWWSLEDKKINLFAEPTKGHAHVYLMVRTNGDDGVPTFGTWGNVFSDQEKIPFFFCSIPPAQNSPSA